jgi:hypothetical protein
MQRLPKEFLNEVADPVYLGLMKAPQTAGNPLEGRYIN